MLLASGSRLIDNTSGAVWSIGAGYTSLSVTSLSAFETFTGGATLASVSNQGSYDTFNFTQGTMTFTDSGNFTNVTLGNGNTTLTSTGAHDTYKLGDTVGATGKSTVTLTGNNAALTGGNGTYTVTSRGLYENVTLGNGSDTVNVYAPGGSGASSGDVFHLGNGARNTLNVYSSNNTIYAGTGLTFLSENNLGSGVNNTVVANAAGGQVSFAGNFTAATGDHLDLTQILGGKGGVTAATLGNFVRLNANVLTVTGDHGTETVTLSSRGSYTMDSLTKSNFFVLPTT